MILNKNYFETIREKISEVLKTSNIKENCFKIEKEDKIYEIQKNENKKVIILKEIFEDSEKMLSSWMFDEENISNKDLKMITEDFMSIINSTNKNNSKQLKKKNSQNRENSPGLFFANRMVNIFPEIKEKIQIEKETYSEFRSTVFIKEILIPKMNNLLNNSNGKNAEIKKLSKLLSDLYSSGTLDTKSIITMGVLNNLENSEILKSYLSDELKKASEYSLKYKGKKVKPENPKKKSSWMTKAFEYQQEYEKINR